MRHFFLILIYGRVHSYGMRPTTLMICYKERMPTAFDKTYKIDWMDGLIGLDGWTG
ncbi:MAG: hypothetical protein H6544_08115 [Prevotellaceae bacterium]|nr:hypothetical protein [Prevotellaceae bacterium]